MDVPLPVVGALFLGIALLYSSTGHGGASGYLAVLLLAGTATTNAVPIALLLNIFVAGIALVAFHQAGGQRFRLFIPLALAGAPMAVLGAMVPLPTPTLGWIIGPALLATAIALWLRPIQSPKASVGWPSLMMVGSGLGFLAGLTGIGGGLYLTPVLLMTGWASKAEAAWTSAAFIVTNSTFGLLARVAAGHTIPAQAWTLVVPVAIGALLGSSLGSMRYSPMAYRRVMGIVVALGGVKAVLAA